MNSKAVIAFIFSLSTTLSSYAQLDPWWIGKSADDSSELHRHMIADTLIEYAKEFIGVPYVWGGDYPESGFDCSGFICYVYKQFGIPMPRTSDEQFNTGIPVKYNEAEAGDIILFTGMEAYGGDPGHVGIVVDYDEEKGFTFIHTSSNETGGVRISNEAGETYYYKRFLEIRRVINVN